VTTLEPKSSAPQRRGPVGRLWARLRADHTLSKRASLNMLASVLDYASRIVVGLLLNPLLVTRLGDVTFGVYQVLGRLIGWATPAGGRPSQALKWTIARHQHSDRYEEKRLQVGSAVAVWVLFLPPLVIAGGLLAWFAPDLVNAPQSFYPTIRIAAGLLVLELIATNLLTIPQSVLQGENLGYKRMGLTTMVVFISGAITAGAVLLGAGLVGVAASTLVSTLLTGLVFWWVTRAQVPWFGIERPPLHEVFTFVRLSGWFLLWNLVMQLMRGSDIVVLGVVGSAQLVTVLALSRYVPEAIFGAVAIVVSGIMPGLGGLLGAQNTDRAVAVRSESMCVTWLLATASGAAFLMWQESFLRLWVGEQYYPGRLATLLIILMVLQFAFIRNDASIIDLTLELRGKVLLGLVASGISIALAVLLLKTWNQPISALAVGFIAGRSVLSIGYPWIVCRSLAIPPSSQIRGVIRPGIVCGLLFGVSLVIAPSLEAGSWLALMLEIGVSVALAGVAAFFLGLARAQRKSLGARFRQVVTF
jgi:O-antigen/teichoic acid export membrane protein